MGDQIQALRESLELITGASHAFDLEEFLAGKLTPVFFGTALGNFGVDHILNGFVDWSPTPKIHKAAERLVEPTEAAFSGFVFKIQANMDPKHRDRIAFLRICSGKYEKGLKMNHVRLGKEIRIADALTFLAGEREHLEEAWAAILLVCIITARFKLAILLLKAKICTSWVFPILRLKCFVVSV